MKATQRVASTERARLARERRRGELKCLCIAPTDDGYPDAKLIDTEVILQHVREWNKHKRIVIHGIGVDIVTSIEFLKKLAAEDLGECIDR